MGKTENIIGPALHLLISLVFVLLFNNNCSPEHKNSDESIEHKTFRLNSSLLKNWDDIFSDHQILVFKFPNAERELYSINGIRINSKGQYIIKDGKAKLAMLFDFNGTFIKNIGAWGEGPGEYLMGLLTELDSQDNLYIYDIMNHQISMYCYPEYSYKKRFLVKSMIRGCTLATPDGYFVDYSLDTLSNYLICKFNDSGKVAKRAFKVKDKNYATFIPRFGLGRINLNPGKGVIFMNPQEYEICIFDYSLNLEKVIKSPHSSTYFPRRKKFPNHLTPFDFTRAHAKWWEKSLIPIEARIFKNYLIIGILHQYIKYSYIQYINLHNLEGNTFAVGIRVPFNGTILYNKDDFIYILEQDKVNDEGQITPQKIHRYKIKDLNPSLLQ